MWVPAGWFLRQRPNVFRARQLHASNEPWCGDARDLEGTSDTTLTSVARAVSTSYARARVA